MCRGPVSGLDNGRADVNSARYIFVTHVPSRSIDVLPPYRHRCEGALLAYRHLDCLDVVCARKKGVAEVPVRATGFVIKRVRMCVRAHDAPASKCAAPTLERCALMRLTTAVFSCACPPPRTLAGQTEHQRVSVGMRASERARLRNHWRSRSRAPVHASLYAHVSCRAQRPHARACLRSSASTVECLPVRRPAVRGPSHPIHSV